MRLDDEFGFAYDREEPPAPQVDWPVVAAWLVVLVGSLTVWVGAFWLIGVFD